MTFCAPEDARIALVEGIATLGKTLDKQGVPRDCRYVRMTKKNAKILGVASVDGATVVGYDPYPPMNKDDSEILMTRDTQKPHGSSHR